jgi:putative CocE/NonD family hydrolase
MYRIGLVSLWLITSSVLLSQPFRLTAQDTGFEQEYTKHSHMIPMRDGVRLYTEVYLPNDAGPAAPIIFLRTPYGVKNSQGGFTGYFRSTFCELAKEGYIFAVQDARGRHESEGQFEWNRPLRHHRDPQAVDPSTDAYDSIDWLVKELPGNNGRVGMLGVSYPGWYVTMALINPHPALRAASPQASPSDYFIGDDFFHFGAFRLQPSAELPYLFDFDPKQNSRFPYDQVDTYEFFLDLGPLSNMNARYLRGASPTWDRFMRHATYDEFWQTGNTLQHLTQVTVPTLNVVGWWDAENLGGALDIYQRLETSDLENKNWIVVGPWAHGQWARGPADRLGAYKFGSDTVTYYQREIEAPFFAKHLKDQATEFLPEAVMFQTGSNQWKQYEQWPPSQQTQRQDWFFTASGALQLAQPMAANPELNFVEYVSDPDKPVPYSQRPIMGFWQGLPGSNETRFGRAGILWKVEDQRFVSDRADVVTFVSEPLTEAVEVTGQLTAQLFASTTGTDSDWVVKLIDVYPEHYPDQPEMGGYQLMIADDVLRGKFRDGFEEPKAIEPGQVESYRIDLRTRNHLFRPGHRIMVQVQSSWFPLIDRNPQTFVDIPNATEADYQRATQRIYCSPEYPSRIEMAVNVAPRN